MIPHATIQLIVDACRIEEVVGDFVQLKRRGVNMIGNCPFHNERTPSFNVNPVRNIYKCFGCGEAGGPVNFVMKHENMTYPEALRYLAGKYGIEVKEEEKSDEYIKEQQSRDSIYLANDFALKFYQEQLFDTDYGKSVGLSYFKERGFREDTIRKWGLGYAPEGDKLVATGKSKAYSTEILAKAGLATTYHKDFFRNRVMFTIHGLSGKVLGFAGRILVKDKNLPKYINTPENEIYLKSKILYGAWFAKNAIRKEDECFLVEGYTDVISLHQEGIENVLASSGTSLTVDQIALVKRFSNNLTILYDGDAAGIKAALRGLDLALEQDLNVRVVLLPDGEDPDSYMQRVGSEQFKEFIQKNKKDIILFKTQLVLEESKGDPLMKSKLVHDIVSSIAFIPDAIKRSVYIKSSSELLGISEAILVSEVNNIVQGRLTKFQERRQAPLPQTPQPKSIAPARPLPQGLPPLPGEEEPIGVGSSDIPLPDQEEASSGGKFGGAPLPDDDWAAGLEESDGFAPSLEDGEYAPQKAEPATLKTGDEFQERDIARILVMFSDKMLGDGHTVAQYVLAEMEELLDEFDSALYRKVVVAALDGQERGILLDGQFWVNHSDSEIASFSMGVSISPYVYSENWEKRLGVTLQSQKIPEENFLKDTLSSVNRFKFVKINRLRAQNQQKLKDPNLDQTDLIIILKVQQKLNDMREQLAALLRSVVS